MPLVPRSMARLTAAGAPVEMEPQAQPVQVLEGLQPGPADGPLPHPGEQPVAQLAERQRQQPRHPVGHHQRHRHGDHGPTGTARPAAEPGVSASTACL